MRADELGHGDRIHHPFNDMIVTVDRTTVGPSWVKVYFKASGAHGSFKTNPQTEIGEA